MRTPCRYRTGAVNPGPQGGEVWGAEPGAGARPGTGKAGVGVCRADSLEGAAA